jgi:hypothetical protein
MPHEERGVFMSNHSQVEAPSRNDQLELPQTLALAALSYEIEQDAMAGGDLDKAKTLFTWFADEGISGGGGVAAYGGQYAMGDHLSVANLRKYWRDPQSLPFMCVQRIDQEMETQRATKKKRTSSTAAGIFTTKVGRSVVFVCPLETFSTRSYVQPPAASSRSWLCLQA